MELEISRLQSKQEGISKAMEMVLGKYHWHKTEEEKKEIVKPKYYVIDAETGEKVSSF
jgi:hypothetical protein